MTAARHETAARADEAVELPSLGGLEPEHRRELAACMQPCAYAAGEVLFHAGTEAERAMIVITHGVVELRRGHNGAARTVATLHAGSVLGETSLLLPGPHTVSAHARTDVRALRLDAPTFGRLVAACRPAALALVLHLGATLASRLRRMNDALGTLLAERGCAADRSPILSDIEHFRHKILHEWQV